MSAYRRPVDAAALGHNFRIFAEAECEAEPLYAALSHAIATQDDVLALLLQTPYPQRRPVLLFAATHDLLLAGCAHPLADFYRTCVDDDGAPRGDVDEAGGLFADFCRVQRDALVESLTQRTVQTNEIGRSAVLRLALATLPPDRPIALIDVGCSAGLNLLVDRYRYAFGLPDGAVRAIGPAGDVVIRAAMVDDLPFGDRARAMPTIAQRFGLDLVPLDVRDDRDARWLRACTWPSDAERHARLAGALALARHITLDLRRGDADRRLPGILDAIEPTVRPVLFHSWVVSYFDQEAKRRFVDAARAMVVERDGAWISAEGPGVVPGLPVPSLEADAGATRREATLWHITTRDGDAAAGRVVARSHPHGRWIEWLATPAGAAVNRPA